MTTEVYENRKSFCTANWKPMVLFLVISVLATFTWGFFVLSDFYDDEDILTPMGAAFFSVASKTQSRFGAITLATVVTVCSQDGGVQNGLKVLGAGVIVNPDGYIVSTNHTVNGVKRIVVQVSTVNGILEYPAEIVKMNKAHDLVLLKLISRDIFPFMPLDETQRLKQGEPVFAFGVQGGGLLKTGKGVVDEIGVNLVLGNYNLTDLLKTRAVKDWAYNGGPLLNNEGVMTGINIAVQDANGKVLGYSVPAHIVIGHFQDIVQFMTTTVNEGNSLSSTQGTQNQTNMGMRQNGTVAVPINQNIPPQFATGGAKPGRPSEDWWGAAQNTVNPNANLEGEFEGQQAGVPQGMNVAMGSPVVMDTDPAHTSKGRIFGYTIGSAIGLLVLGLFTGISGGMMTMGGGIIKVTGLILFFGYGTLLIRPVAYITNVFLYGASSLRYKRSNLIQLDHVRRLIPWAMGGIVIGYFLGNYLGNRLIEILLGIFALFMGGKILSEIVKFGDLEESEASDYQRDDDEEELSDDFEGAYMASQRGGVSASFFKDGLLGVPMGIVSGILGISGGVIEVPLQRYAANVPLKNAIANSSVMVFFASLVGSVLSMIHGVSIGAFGWNTPVTLALFLIPGAYAGGMIGAWLTQQVSLLVLRWVYAVLMFAIALRMLVL